jgi:hypothetical protein
LIDLEGAIKMYDANDEGDMKLFGENAGTKNIMFEEKLSSYAC